jgi:osmoprotectant transport system permease protein
MLASAWQYIVAHPARSARARRARRAVGRGARDRRGDRRSARHRGGAAARVALLAINAANVGRTLPSLAVLALAMPLLGTGFTPALFALTLLALPPILINTYAAVRQVDADVIDAARGMGMTQREITRRVVVPLAGTRDRGWCADRGDPGDLGAVLAAYIGGGGSAISSRQASR